MGSGLLTIYSLMLHIQLAEGVFRFNAQALCQNDKDLTIDPNTRNERRLKMYDPPAKTGPSAKGAPTGERNSKKQKTSHDQTSSSVAGPSRITRSMEKKENRGAR